MKNLSENGNYDINITLCGQAGQGIQTVERLFTRILKAAGCNVFATKEYMSRVRGGMNSTLIRVSDSPVRAFSRRIDILVPLDKGAIAHLKNRITSDTVILGDKNNCDESGLENTLIDINFTKSASDIGSKLYSNTVAVGALLSVLSIEPNGLADCVKQFFAKKSEEIQQNNVKALKAGHKKASEKIKDNGKKFPISVDEDVKKHILINGAEAVGAGAIAGGCNFISSYPMSPSTGVLVFLAQNADDFGVLAEQAEDEIAAVNMAIGAWYAGARAMVTTSGGGFALMTEGVSLAGMVESPLVVHLAQRPGPATGLPTRTEQGDLELALYAGHGEFPRIIFAPGTLEEGFYLTQRAFKLADEFQVPVFIMTDQYFMDSYYNRPEFSLEDVEIEKHFIVTAKGYRRFELTESGISPRGIPGFGEGLVMADSDEHDEEGHITEDFGVRTEMVDKRLKKLELIKKKVEPPKIHGPEDYEKLVICWGSTFNIVVEAVTSLAGNDTAVMHFGQVYPLHENTAEMIAKANKTVVVENNATGQFAKLLKRDAQISIDHNIFKYNGLCFAANDLAEKLKELL